MSQAIVATLSARLDKPEQAYGAFLQSYRPNQLPPFGVLAETAGGSNPYFATGAGGSLQALLFGFGGLRIGDNGITQTRQRLPAAWQRLVIKGVGPQHTTVTVER